MKSITIERTNINYLINAIQTFKGTITEGKSYLFNYYDEETFAGIVDSIFLDPDGDEVIEVIRPDGESEFVPAKGIYSFDEIK